MMSSCLNTYNTEHILQKENEKNGEHVNENSFNALAGGRKIQLHHPIHKNTHSGHKSVAHT